MTRYFTLSLAAVFVLSTILASARVVLGQQSNSSAVQSQQEPTVKIGVTLVQVDAVVTDKRGNQVRDLTPNDFEVLVDGHKQHITNFSYINVGPSTEQKNPASRSTEDKLAAALPPPELRPDQVRRTIVIVIDDLSLSWESSVQTKMALKQFVDHKIEPGDLVAIISTGGGSSVLQQLTSDKRWLDAAVDRLDWNPAGIGEIGAINPLYALPNLSNSPGKRVPPSLNVAGSRIGYSHREEVFTVGTFSSLYYILRGLKDLPGRKPLILLSDAFSLAYGDPHDSAVRDGLRQLVDFANRASVSIYPVDPRGLQTLQFTAEDETGGLDEQALREALARRSNTFISSQESMRYLANQTGGLAFTDSNDLPNSLNKVIKDQSGYYLIGFVPDSDTFTPINGARPFHEIKVKVKGHGLHVRSDHGFYGETDEEMRKETSDRTGQLYWAMISPFSSNGVDVKLTSLFSNSKKEGSFVLSMVHIDPRSLTFRDERDGWKRSVFDVAEMAFGVNGELAGAVNRTETVRFRTDALQNAIDRGLTFSLNLPIKQEGAYQVRVAVRDTATRKVGSAMQFLTIPDLKKKRLALSGIVVQGQGDANRLGASGKGSEPTGDVDEKSKARPTDDTTVVRNFKPGESLDLGFLIFNPSFDPSTRESRLDLRMRVFKDGSEVNAGKQSLQVEAPSDPERLGASATLVLDPKLKAGHYLVQVICTDLLAAEKYRVASSWTDFNVK